MAKKNMQRPSETPTPMLAVPRQDAQAKLRVQIDKGEDLKGRPIGSPDELQATEREFGRWEEFNYDLLRRLFTTIEIANRSRTGIYGRDASRKSLDQAAAELREDIEYHVNNLVSLMERLDVFQEAPSVSHASITPGQRQPAATDRVFIVHGHDNEAKLSVARFVEKLGLKAIILHEQSSQGKTIIEKFESHADAGYTIILLTPDDEGRSKSSHDLKDRARQNVVFEHGYFIGRFGRRHVCALVKGNIEIPSDLQGVIYVTMDDREGWHLQLAREMKAAGMQVDLN